MQTPEITKKKILEAALKVFAKHGFETSNVNQIAHEARIAKGTIYYHFKSKNDILYELVERSLENMVVKIKQNIEKAKTPEEKLRAFIKTQASLHVSEPEISRVLIMNYFRLEPVWADLRRKKVKIGEDVIDECKKSGGCKKLDSRIVGMFLHFLILSAITMSSLVLADKSMDDITKTLEKILVTGILSNKA